jgi:hypothetical protein
MRLIFQKLTGDAIHFLGMCGFGKTIFHDETFFGNDQI